MRKLFSKMWQDDDGIVAFEYLLVATIIGLSLVVGLSAVSHALNIELTELANAILNLNQTYTYDGQSTCTGSVLGAAVTDSTASNLINYGSIVPTNVPIDIGACN